ncbi:sensor histidine kinase [Alkalibacillus aidingensis]|uniref:sensor histidine kinase n=1 Tax=Alkalibacillus aidingensis TaxID=2747607 RepID=UPI0016605F98|nr:ATP-binding protein [Alkalibacillus aidingensis]
MKLSNKIFFFTTGLFIVLLTAFAVAINVLFSENTYDRELDRIQIETENMVSSLAEVSDTIPVNDLLRAYVPSNGMIRVLDQDLDIITSIAAGDQTELYYLSLPERTGRTVEIIDDEEGKLALIQEPMIWVDGQVVYVQVVEDLGHIDENLSNLQLVLLFVVLMGIIPAIVSGKLLTDLIIEPIQSLIRTMNEIKEDQTFKQIPLNRQSKDELYTMSATFNDMISLLKENYEKQEAFVSNASHELRTPLTVIESYANLVKRHGLSRPEVVEEAIEAIHSESLRMKELTEQLLLLAKRDQDWRMIRQEVNINQLLTDVSHKMSQTYDRSVNFISNLEADLHVLTDDQKLTQLLYIILDNALKYSDDEVKIHLSDKEGQPVIKVVDYGIGIPKQKQNQVFERFYRVDEARNRQTGGSGLGLTLAKEIADVLELGLHLESEVDVGTTVYIIFTERSH